MDRNRSLRMTIKTQNGKVITKDGKVSCECCGGCCMYPAQELGEELYSEDDLPDSVIFNRGGTQYVLAKIEPESGVYYSGAEGLDGYFAYGVQLVETIIGEESFYEWKLARKLGDNPPDWEQAGDIDACLFRLLPSELPNIADPFADTYVVSGSISGTVTRESVCVWVGPNLRLTNFGFQWRVNGNNKSGNQNTPVGSYAGGYSVE
jgi:hypothetical protein